MRRRGCSSPGRRGDVREISSRSGVRGSAAAGRGDEPRPAWIARRRTRPHRVDHGRRRILRVARVSRGAGLAGRFDPREGGERPRHAGDAVPARPGIARPGSTHECRHIRGLKPGHPPLFALAVAWLAWLHRPREALFLAIASGGSLVLNEMMKLFFQRPRPQLDWAQVLPDYSFPSGHTMNSLVFYVALAVVLWSVRGRR